MTDIYVRSRHVRPAAAALPAQVTHGESQRDAALALWRHVPAARVQVLESTRPALPVAGLLREAPHAPQLQPAALRVRFEGRGEAGTCTRTRYEQQQQRHQNHLRSCHLHLPAARPITGWLFTLSEVTSVALKFPRFSSHEQYCLLYFFVISELVFVFFEADIVLQRTSRCYLRVVSTTSRFGNASRESVEIGSLQELDEPPRPLPLWRLVETSPEVTRLKT